MSIYDFVSTTTSQHTIIIKNDSLTITGNDMTLSPDETKELLDVLLIWQYGLEAISPDDVEK